MGLTKEQIEEFLESEKEACDTWGYLDLAVTFKDYQSIVTSYSIANLSKNATPISEAAMDMAIKLKAEATEDELEGFICHLEEYDLSDRVDQLK